MNNKKTSSEKMPNQDEMKKLEIYYKSKEFDKLAIHAKNLIKEYSKVAELYNILGIALEKQGNLNQAISNFDKAISINPKFFLAYNNLGNVMKNLGKFEQSLYQYEQAIKIKPDYFNAYYNLASLYRYFYKYNEAIENYRKAIKIKPNYTEAYNNLGHALNSTGKFDEALECYKKAIKIKPDYTQAYSNILFTLLYDEKDNHKYYLEEAKNFRLCLKPINNNLIKKYQFNNKPKKLKIGFVSGDFKKHPVGFFLQDTMTYLKNKNLELYAYSNSRENDSLTKKLKSNFTIWNQISEQNDTQVINQIRNDGIHILIDMSGHSSKNRLSIFINKPAPIQVTWGGFAGSTGVTEIDYIIGDPQVTPENDKNLYTEKIFNLPYIWCCFSIPEFDVKLKETPAIKNGFVTFGSFNNLSKINNNVIKLWSKILNSIPKSKIFLKANELHDPFIKQLILNKFKKNNIDSNLILLEGASPRDELLSTYNKIDIALDTFPYSGGTTSFESSWMSTPVLTKIGHKFVSSSTASINYNLGMSDWICKNEEDYIRKAIKFSSNIKQLNQIKKNLRKKAISSPLFNAKLFSDVLDDALWKMWNKFILKN